MSEQLSANNQRWVYVQNLFEKENIKKNLPNEVAAVKQGFTTWNIVMEESKKSNNLNEFVNSEDLDIIEKKLNDWIDSKRNVFPRFYFLSMEELLEIFGDPNNVVIIDRNLVKCFEGISNLEFFGKKVVGMRSKLGELIKFANEIDTNSEVELWMGLVEKEMVEAVKSEIKKGWEELAKMPREKWVLGRCGQALLSASLIHFTNFTEEAIMKGGDEMKKQAKLCLDQLQEIVKLLRTNLSELDRRNLEGMIIFGVKNIDIANSLVQKNVKDVNDYSWQFQLRSYYENNSLVLKMSNFNLPYSYEYIGNSPRLVITPLTDRCYRSLISSIALHYGGSPAGPAGVGKSETTKELGLTLGRRCIVIYCSDQLNYKSNQQILKGLSASGAWGIFDEFNRIDVEVISIFAMQIANFLNAKKKGEKTIVYDGDSKINFNPLAHVFLTMNPGYAGRTELPDGLKAMFRPVAMMIPDYCLIAEIMLYSNGFLNANNLATKIVATFKISSELLSRQDFYDFGMRAVKAVVITARNLKINNQDADETVLVRKALEEVMCSKLTNSDLLVFKGILSDLFPGVNSFEEKEIEAVAAAIAKRYEQNNLKKDDYLLEKTLQLYKTIKVRHSVIVIGSQGSGKSTIIKVLSEALSDLEKKSVEVRKINHNGGALFNDFSKGVKHKGIGPLDYNEFYGSSNEKGEWKDGPFSEKFRELANMNNDNYKWLHLDAPIDPIWVEPLNQVMDDNKKLTLASREVIHLSNNMSLIFEVEHVKCASPATISRCGVVLIDTGKAEEKVVPKNLNIDSSKLDFSKVEVDNEEKTACLSLQKVVQETIEKVDKNAVEQVVKEVSNLYLAVRELKNLNSTYRFSLECFTNLFQNTVNNSEKNGGSILKNFKNSLYCKVSRALFEKDRILFAMMMAVRVTDKKHEAIEELFHKTNPEKMLSVVTKFVEENLGSQFTTSSPALIEEILKESDNKTPLVLVKDIGVYPVENVLKLAEQIKMDKLDIISLGQGQGSKAEKLIETGAKTGRWVVLENCHLHYSWMKGLENCWNNLKNGELHKDFRLWLITLPSDCLPTSVLENSLKMTFEKPKGFKNKLERVVQKILVENSEIFNACPKRSKEYRRLLLAICFFHCVVIESQAYGSIAWNICYDFEDEDLVISAKHLQILLENSPENCVPIEALRYFISEINYGGRVRDDKDRRKIQNLIKVFVCEELLSNPNYNFNTIDAYKLPQNLENASDILKWVQFLPENTSPLVLLLNQNADLQRNIHESLILHNSLCELHSKKHGLSKEAWEKVATDLLKEIPDNIDLEKATAKFPFDYKESLNLILIQEINKYNTLLDGYVSDLKKRIEFVQNWIEKGIPESFWFPGLFFPQSLLTAVLQNFARKNVIPIDRLALKFEVVNEKVTERPKDGAYIHGLFLEGAKWNSAISELDESDPELVPCKIEEKDYLPCYQCPLYRNTDRKGVIQTTGHSSNFVMIIDLPTKKPNELWVNRGVALLTQLND